MSYPSALADLNLCNVFKRVFFNLAAAELLVTPFSADKNILLVALIIILIDFEIHYLNSFISSRTFKIAIKTCMCPSNASDHLLPAL